jgi:hypothetical protein
MIWYEGTAVLKGAEFQWKERSADSESRSTGFVQGSDPAYVGQQIRLRSSHPHSSLDSAAEEAVVDMSKAVFRACKIICINSGKALTVYFIASFKSSKAMEVYEGSTAERAPIVQWTYNQGSNQHWKLNEIGNNDYTIESIKSGKVLDVQEASTANGAAVIQFSYKQGLNQRWRIEGL